MRRPRSKLEVSTFPFLAVLLCAMGSLLLFLFIMDRRAKIVAQSRARAQYEAAVVRTPDTQPELDTRQADWEKAREQLRQLLLDQQQEVEAEASNLQKNLSEAAQKLQVVQAKYLNTQEQIAGEASRILMIEGQLARQRDEIQQAEKQDSASKSELAKATQELIDLNNALQFLKAQRIHDKDIYSVVPYRGKRGDMRMPIYVECVPGGVVFHPEKTELAAFGMTSAALIREVERHVGPIAVEKPAKTTERGMPQERKGPYVLFLVRPDGIDAYYKAQALLRGYQLDFGYELVDAGWVLDFSGNVTANQKVLPPVRTQIPPPPLSAGGTLPGGTGSGPASFGPPPLTSGGYGTGTGSGGAFSGGTGINDGSPGLGANGPVARPGSTAGLASRFGSPGLGNGFTPGPLAQTSGIPNFGPDNNGPGLAGGPNAPGGPGIGGNVSSFGLPSFSGNGSPGGGMPGGGMPGGGMPGGGMSSPGTSASGNGTPGGGTGGPYASTGGTPGTGSNSGNPSSGQTGNGSLVPGSVSAGQLGTPGMKPLPIASAGSVPNGNGFSGSPSSNGSSSGQSGGSGGSSGSGNSSGSGEGTGSTPGSNASPQSPNASSGTPGAPGMPAMMATTDKTGNSNAPASYDPNPPKQETTPNGNTGTSRPSLSGGNSGQGSSSADGPGYNHGVLPQGFGGDPPKRAPAPSPLSKILGNKDFLITLDCYSDHVNLFPGGVQFHWKDAKTQATDQALVQTVTRLIERRQASVRPGEPPYRPMIRFNVYADGRRVYYHVYPLLDSLRVPMSRENVEE